MKTNIGHTSAAAGVASVIKTVLCLQHHQLVPSLNYHEANEHIAFKDSPFYVNTELKEWVHEPNTLRRAAVSSFGFSGTNAHLVLEEAPLVAQQETAAKPAYLITLSAKTETARKDLLNQLNEWLAQSQDTLEAISYTLNTGRSHFDYRFAIVVSSIQELQTGLKTFLEGKTGMKYFVGKVSNKETDDSLIYKQVMENTLEALK